MTRAEAIATVCEALARDYFAMDPGLGSDRRKGARLALEALAAAGVFSDAQPGGGNEYDQAAARLVMLRDMADLLDAAGIR